MKTLIKKALWACGYDIHKRQPQAPDDSILTDEVVSGPWVGRALQVSNRYYRPPVLQHHRSKYGDDTRLKYITDFLDVRDQRILEIGPLEGYLSTILEKMGVRENIAIESRAINLRKCRRTKEKYHLDHTHFVQADLERLYKGGRSPASTAHLIWYFVLVFSITCQTRAADWSGCDPSRVHCSLLLIIARESHDELM